MTKKQEEKDRFKALEEAVSGDENGSVGIVTLSSGVVLKIKPVSPLLLLRLASRYEEPQVPMAMDDTMGRETPNPLDPDYLAAKKAYDLRLTQAMVDGFVMYGTELESAPEEIGTPDEDRWVNMLKAVGEETDPENEFWRYMTWIETQAIKSDDDMKSLIEEVGRMSGVSERDVNAAADNFRGSKEQPKDPGSVS
jgi:hypothetical protein